MTFDGSSARSRSSVVLHGPAQHAIEEFLEIYRCLPARPASARLFGTSPLDVSCAVPYWEAVGELEVVSRLDRLGPEFSVVHGVPGVASADESEPSMIDHLVIGPGGVFSVTTYNHTRQNVWVSRRAFVVDGHSLQHIRLAEAAVGHVERMLGAAVGRPVAATTVIAVIDPGSLHVRDLPRDVFVVAAASLDSWLKKRERELDPEAVAELAASARLGCTWSHEDIAPGDVAAAEQDRAEFERVRREVETAQLVHTGWAIGAVVLAGTLVVLGILQLVS